MRNLTALLIVAVSALVLARAMGADAPERPPGVEASEWIAINDSLGIVVAPPLPGGGPGLAGLTARRSAPGVALTPGSPIGISELVPPTEGYLMVKRGLVWHRLQLVEPVKGPGPAG